MTSNHPFVHPPRVAAWFVELFASRQEADAILGDLAEDFSACVAREGAKEARRHYRRQARRTIRDLALSPWTTGSGLALATGIGFTGWIMMLAIARPAMITAGALVARYPVYDHVPASFFWRVVQFCAPLMAGFLTSLIAQRVRFRPMTAGLALVVAISIVLAVDAPIMKWLYGARFAPSVMTFTWWAGRWVEGVVTFGSAMLVGAALGRIAPLPEVSVHLRPTARR